MEDFQFISNLIAENLAQRNLSRLSCVACGIWHVALPMWNLAIRMPHVESGIWHDPCGIWHVALPMWNLAFGTTHVESDIWHAPCGIWHQECHLEIYDQRNIKFHYFFGTNVLTT